MPRLLRLLTCIYILPAACPYVIAENPRQKVVSRLMVLQDDSINHSSRRVKYHQEVFPPFNTAPTLICTRSSSARDRRTAGLIFVPLHQEMRCILLKATARGPDRRWTGLYVPYPGPVWSSHSFHAFSRLAFSPLVCHLAQVPLLRRALASTQPCLTGPMPPRD